MLATTTTWGEVSARAGRADLPYLLAKAALIDGVLTDQDEIAKAVADAWVSPEWPSRALDAEVWDILFTQALSGFDGYLTDGGDICDRDNLPETLTLWRGAAVGHEYGMSWTADEARGRWFATRFGGHIGGEHVLLRADVPRDLVLAHFTRRNEDEYVLDAKDIADYVTRVDL